MDIQDEIKIAQAEWIIKHKEAPEQIILPKEAYSRLQKVAEDQNNYGVYTSHGVAIGSYCGMKLYVYDGERMVFS